MIEMRWSDKKEIRRRTIADIRVIEALDKLFEIWQRGGGNIGEALGELKIIYEKVYHEKEKKYLEETEAYPEIRAGFYKKYADKPIHVVKSGIKVRSKMEKIIANFYYDMKIKFEYEKPLIVGDQWFFSDFFLSKFRIFHEHLGSGDDAYEQNKEFKMQYYENMPVIFTDIKDEPNIEDVLLKKLAEKGISFQRA